jgi:hypothetical protein
MKALLLRCNDRPALHTEFFAFDPLPKSAAPPNLDDMTTEGASALASKLSVFPRMGLASLPTSLEPMRRLTAHLGGPRLWVKREDATGLGFGGNKLRKLDYVLHDAVASKADVLVSGGVVQSNSQRQVAAAAAKLGIECHLVLLSHPAESVCRI